MKRARIPDLARRRAEAQRLGPNSTNVKRLGNELAKMLHDQGVPSEILDDVQAPPKKTQAALRPSKLSRSALIANMRTAVIDYAVEYLTLESLSARELDAVSNDRKESALAQARVLLAQLQDVADAQSIAVDRVLKSLSEPAPTLSRDLHYLQVP